MLSALGQTSSTSAVASQTTAEPRYKTNHDEAKDEEKPHSSFAITPLKPRAPYKPKVSTAFLRDVAQRCRLKQRIALWAAGLPEGMLSDESRSARDRFEAEARALPHCSPWMLPSAHGIEAPSSSQAYATLALAYEASALASEAFRSVDDLLLSGSAPSTPSPSERTVVFSGATVQSALRVAAQAVRSGYDEPEQRTLFRWLRGYTAWREVYVNRHMRLEDPASPEDLPRVVETLRAILEEGDDYLSVASAAQVPKEQPRAESHADALDLSALRYHAEQAAEGGFMADHHWNRVADLAGEALDSGLSPHAPILREALAPLAGNVPDSIELPNALGEALMAA